MEEPDATCLQGAESPRVGGDFDDECAWTDSCVSRPLELETSALVQDTDSVADPAQSSLHTFPNADGEVQRCSTLILDAFKCLDFDSDDFELLESSEEGGLDFEKGAYSPSRVCPAFSDVCTSGRTDLLSSSNCEDVPILPPLGQSCEQIVDADYNLYSDCDSNSSAENLDQSLFQVPHDVKEAINLSEPQLLVCKAKLLGCGEEGIMKRFEMTPPFSVADLRMEILRRFQSEKGSSDQVSLFVPRASGDKICIVGEADLHEALKSLTMGAHPFLFIEVRLADSATFSTCQGKEVEQNTVSVTSYADSWQDHHEDPRCEEELSEGKAAYTEEDVANDERASEGGRACPEQSGRESPPPVFPEEYDLLSESLGEEVDETLLQEGAAESGISETPLCMEQSDVSQTQQRLPDMRHRAMIRNSRSNTLFRSFALPVIGCDKNEIRGFGSHMGFCAFCLVVSLFTVFVLWSVRVSSEKTSASMEDGELRHFLEAYDLEEEEAEHICDMLGLRKVVHLSHVTELDIALLRLKPVPRNALRRAVAMVKAERKQTCSKNDGHRGKRCTQSDVLGTPLPPGDMLGDSNTSAPDARCGMLATARDLKCPFPPGDSSPKDQATSHEANKTRICRLMGQEVCASQEEERTAIVADRNETACRMDGEQEDEPPPQQTFSTRLSRKSVPSRREQERRQHQDKVNSLSEDNNSREVSAYESIDRIKAASKRDSQTDSATKPQSKTSRCANRDALTSGTPTDRFAEDPKSASVNRLGAESIKPASVHKEARRWDAWNARQVQPASREQKPPVSNRPAGQGTRCPSADESHLHSKPECAKQESAKQESKQGSSQQPSTKQESGKQQSAKQDTSAKQDIAKQQSAKRDTSAKQESGKQESAKQETSAKQGSAKPDSAKPESTTHESGRGFSERAKARRKEARTNQAEEGATSDGRSDKASQEPHRRAGRGRFGGETAAGIAESGLTYASRFVRELTQQLSAFVGSLPAAEAPAEKQAVDAPRLMVFGTAGGSKKSVLYWLCRHSGGTDKDCRSGVDDLDISKGALATKVGKVRILDTADVDGWEVDRAEAVRKVASGYDKAGCAGGEGHHCHGARSRLGAQRGCSREHKRIADAVVLVMDHAETHGNLPHVRRMIQAIGQDDPSSGVYGHKPVVVVTGMEGCERACAKRLAERLGLHASPETVFPLLYKTKSLCRRQGFGAVCASTPFIAAEQLESILAALKTRARAFAAAHPETQSVKGGAHGCGGGGKRRNGSAGHGSHEGGQRKDGRSGWRHGHHKARWGEWYAPR